MTAPLRIAFVVNSLRFGGAEKHTLQLFNDLPQDGFRPALAYLKREEHLLPEADGSRGPLWCADFGKGLDFAGLRRLASWLKDVRPDVLVCANTYPLFYGHLALMLCGSRARIIEIFHSTELPAREDRRMRWIYRHFFNRSDGIVYVSEAQRRYWEARGIRRELGRVIHNGIDTEHFRDRYDLGKKHALRARYGFGPDDFVIGICAALRPEKRHEDLIEAVARLKSGGIAAKGLIIGDGPRRATLEAEAAGKELTRDIAITGFQTDVRPFVAACDCMAIVSHHETFSIAALEGMAMGKPMVLSAVGGAGEQVREGENGHLFPAADVDALTQILVKLADPKRRAELGCKARMLVERDFGMKPMLEKYTRLFHEVAEGG